MPAPTRRQMRVPSACPAFGCMHQHHTRARLWQREAGGWGWWALAAAPLSPACVSSGGGQSPRATLWLPRCCAARRSGAVHANTKLIAWHLQHSWAVQPASTGTARSAASPARRPPNTGLTQEPGCQMWQLQEVCSPGRCRRTGRCAAALPSEPAGGAALWCPLVPPCDFPGQQPWKGG
jgi:hypothetical protein